MRLALLLAFLASPALAYTPEELVRPRDIAIDCKAGTCTLSEGDLTFLMQQNQLLGNIAVRIHSALKDCQGGRAT